MIDLVIAGAGGCAREVLEWVRDINAAAPAPVWNLRGFIADDRETALAGHDCGLEAIDTIVDYRPRPGEQVAVAIGSPQGRRIVAERLREKGAVFATIVHPSAIVCASARIGTGGVVYPYSVVGVDTVVGDFVTVLGVVSTDSRVGDFSTVGPCSYIENGVSLGAGVELASHVYVLGGVTLGNNVFVAAGSVVVGDFPDNVRLWGNPARESEI